MAESHIVVEVVYATPEHQASIPLNMPPGSTIESAITTSGICDTHPEIDLHKNATGIFGCRLPLSHTLLDGDRIEIYRPLQIDPKDARRIRHARSQYRSH